MIGMLRAIVMPALGVIALMAQAPHEVLAQPRLPGQRMQLVPQDESAQAPNFVAFLARFRQVVERRDVSPLLAMMSREITPEPFGDNALIGRDAFRKYHSLDDPKSKFWSVVTDLLGKGAAVEGCKEAEPGAQCQVTYPYWSKRFPDDRLDRSYYRIVRDESVPMYDAPSSSAKVVQHLSYEIVLRVADTTLEWKEVSLLDGQRGFVRVERLYDPATGYRMSFRRLDTGFWVLEALVVGD